MKFGVHLLRGIPWESEEPINIRLAFEQLGLNANEEYQIYGLWNKKKLRSFKSEFANPVSAHGADWAKVDAHLRFAEKLSKAAHCKGIIWDAEQYKPGKNPWRLADQEKEQLEGTDYEITNLKC